MKLHYTFVIIVGLLFSTLHLQAATSDFIQKDFKSEIKIQSQKLIQSTKRFFKKTTSKVKKILDSNKENMMVFGVLLFLLLVGSLLTFVILKLAMVITWSWAIVLIPLYILVLLFLYALIPMKATSTN